MQVTYTVGDLNGDGSFQAQSIFALGSFPFGIAVGNSSGDDHLDIAAMNTGDNSVSVLLGKRCGA